MKKSLLTFILLLGVIIANAQQKEIDKAKAQAATGDYEKAMKTMRAAADKYNTNAVWDEYVTLAYEKNEKQPDQSVYMIIAIMDAMKDIKLEGTEGGDSLNLTFSTADKQRMMYGQMLDIASEALSRSQSSTASIYSRIFKVDMEVEVHVATDSMAKEHYKKAEKAFGKRQYEAAKTSYLRAITIDPEFYKANLYLGDTYYALRNYDSAQYYFQKCIDWQPTLLEPRIYMIDALAGKKDSDAQALKACIDAFTVFPAEHLWNKFDDIADRNSMVVNRHWIPRGIEVYEPGNTGELTKYKKGAKYWSAYAKAIEDIEKEYDQKGIFLPDGPRTYATYVEVYLWEKMLQSSSDPQLAFAKQMQEEGYLDCYVLISQFHPDLYDQFLHLIKNNPQKVEDYLRKYVISAK